MKNLLISIFVLGVLLCSNANNAYANQIQKMLAGDAQANDNFGNSVSISGDYAIVGAYQEGVSGSKSGAAYLYYRNEGGTDSWGQVTKLKAHDTEGGDYFGISVSIWGDYAIIGAINEDAGGNNAGAAYVFNRNEGGTNNWGEVTKLTASDAAAGDSFGISVSIWGDYAIVGARYEDAGGIDAGAAYVFNRNEGGTNNWGEVTKLTASDAAADDSFGYSVSIWGDYAIVGAVWEDAGGGNAGAAYVFNKNEGGTDNWGEVTKLIAGDAEGGDNFGVSVSISGDYAIVGARYEDTGGIDAGAAYVFNRNEGGTDNWGEVTKLTASDAAADDSFGYSVSIWGDYAIVGAVWEDAGGGNAGAAYLFNKDQGGADSWGEVTKLTADDAQYGDNFGSSVSISGGVVNTIVGAFREDAGGIDAGATYMFQMFPFIPTLPEWGMIAMGLLFAGIGGWFVFRRI